MTSAPLSRPRQACPGAEALRVTVLYSEAVSGGGGNTTLGGGSGLSALVGTVLLADAFFAATGARFAAVAAFAFALAPRPVGAFAFARAAASLAFRRRALISSRMLANAAVATAA